MQEESTQWVVNIYLQVRVVSSSVSRRARRSNYFFASSAAFSPSFLAFSDCFARTSLISACVARGCQYSRTEGKGRT